MKMLGVFLTTVLTPQLFNSVGLGRQEPPSIKLKANCQERCGSMASPKKLLECVNSIPFLLAACFTSAWLCGHSCKADMKGLCTYTKVFTATDTCYGGH